MKYVVTGGAGFIGSNIVKLLVKNGHNVIIIDNLHSGKKENIISVEKDIEFFNYDILDYEKIEKICKDVDGIFHQAALTVVQESYEQREKYQKVNVKGTENIFKIGKKFGIKIVFASSSSVYGDVKEIPIKENFERNPINPYGQTKLDDEFLAEDFTNDGTSIIGLRYFNVFGIGQNLAYAGVLTKFLHNISKKLSPQIFGTGEQRRDFIHVEDVAQANYDAMNSEVNKGFFNIGTGDTITISELARKILEFSKLDLKEEYLEAIDGDIKYSQADIQHARELLHWSPKNNLIKWLDDTISHKKWNRIE
tara:strand:- start:1718 stop:2641 length:924 start_codon:yes stop_codon:yes gene_type:complete